MSGEAAANALPDADFSPGLVGQATNIGMNQEIAVEALAEMIAEILCVKVTISKDNGRLRPARSEVERLVADNLLAHELLAWEPRVDLEEGLERTIPYFKQRLGLV